jgi:hypothetical protein
MLCEAHLDTAHGKHLMKRYGSAHFRCLVFLPLFAVLAACGSDATAPEPDPTVTGSWSGAGNGFSLQLTLNQQPDGSVAGSGSITSPTGSIALTVSSGTHAFPNLSLTLGATGLLDTNLTGTVTATMITATLNGSGFTDESITLTK